MTTVFNARFITDNELEQIASYERRIEMERQLGRHLIGGLLDQMCTDLGLDPATTWRIPRAEEARAAARRRYLPNLPTGSHT